MDYSSFTLSHLIFHETQFFSILGTALKGNRFSHSLFSLFSPILEIATYEFAEYHDGTDVSLNGYLGLVGCWVTATSNLLC